jgi:hypothetical protein
VTQPRRALAPVATDPLLEALIELARSAIQTDREAQERRAKMAIVKKHRGGRAA